MLVGGVCRGGVLGPKCLEEEAAWGACLSERSVIFQHLALD